MARKGRKTIIIATVGPACQRRDFLQKLAREGVDIFRINVSHTAPGALRHWIFQVREAARRSGRRLPVLVDLQGPRVRTGFREDGSIRLLEGRTVSISINARPARGEGITTSCLLFRDLVKKGDPILIDNGLIELKVLRAGPHQIRCRVVEGGVLGSNKGINLPRAPIRLPTLTEGDKRAVRIASELRADYLALSFVRSEDDILAVKKLVECGKSIPIIAKIEKPVALEHMNEIMEVSEGIMVARGDLGIEIGIEKVPIVQKKLIKQANEKGLFSITATQMLETMIERPRPTRAEASDIANAVLDGSGAVMLSGETAVGKYPVQAVVMMSRIIAEAERYMASEGKT